MGLRRSVRARSRTCRRRARSARASSTASTTSCCARAGSRSAQVLLTFFDMSARTHYLNARQTLRQAARLARRPGHQRERHDGDRRDLLRRQRLPRRAGRDPGRRRPARAADRRRRPLHRRPAHRPDAPRSCRRSTDFAALGGAGDRPLDVGARLGRDALEGRRGRDGDRGRHPGRHLQRAARRARSAPRSRASRGHALPAAARRATRRFKLWLRYAKPARGTLVVDAGAARALRDGGTSLLPVGIVGGARRLRRRRRGRGRATARSHRQGDRQLLGRRAAARSWAEVRARVRELLPRATEEADAPRLLRAG